MWDPRTGAGKIEAAASSMRPPWIPGIYIRSRPDPTVRIFPPSPINFRQTQVLAAASDPPPPPQILLPLLLPTMELLDNSLSVGLDALSFGHAVTFATSIWNWVAVVIAALGFWRICAFAAFNSDKPPTIDKNQPVQPSEPKMESLSSRPPGSRPEISRPANAVFKSDCHVAFCHKSAVFEAFDCSWCLPEDEGQRGGEGDAVDADDGVSEEEEEEMKSTTAAAMIFTRGDLGWYRYQEPTAINGNVIRLWEGHRHRRPLPSGKLYGGPR